MLKRHAYNDLLEWKQSKANEALLVMGARQVGKTTLVREFARQNYEAFAEINFLENDRAIEAISKSNNGKDLLFRISALAQTELVPGNTLIFLDEIQACEDVLTWIKFLKEAGNFDFVLSGSLLGIDLFNVRSVPVGYLRTTTMKPFTFLEFCEAAGMPASVLDSLHANLLDRVPVPDFLHEELTDLFYKYLLVGGMPAAVQAYVETNDVSRVRSVQTGIVDSYRMDITKYVSDPAGRSHIKTIYDAIPIQLNKENKRFKFAKLGKNERFSHLATAFDWLENAGIALPTLRITEPSYPLGLSADASSFKLFLNDVGLLTSYLMRDADIEILNHRSSMNFGSIFENVVAQELFAQEIGLFYYNAKGVGEVDFVAQGRAGDISLLEVKSGKDYKRHRAMDNLLATKNYQFKNAIVLHDGNMETEEGIVYLPIYFAGLLKEVL